MQKNLPWGQVPGSNNRLPWGHAMGTGTWQQQPSDNGCQVPVPWQMDDYFHISCISFGILIHSFILLYQSH